MTQGPACYQDVDDVLDLSYVPKTSEGIEVDDILDLSYVPNTAEDIVLAQAPTLTTALIDQGANGGITGIDTRVIEYHPCRTVDICGMDNHEITFIPIGATAGAVARSQWGGCNSYNAPVPISSAARKVNSFFMSIGIFCQ